MPSITLAQAETKLSEYLAAETAVLAGQSWSMGGKSMTKANLQFIQQGIEIWNARVKKLASNPSGGIRIFSGVPVDR